MPPPPAERELPRTWRFGQAVVDERGRTVTVAGTEAALDLSGYHLLLALLRHAGEVVTKEELFEIGWPGRVVADNTLTKSISRLRAALGADGAAIGAVYSYGYRLSAPVAVEVPEAIAPSVAPATPIAPAPPETGDAVLQRPGWTLAERLGAGATGVAYLARDGDGQTRVFKFADGDSGLRGLRREVALNRYLAIGESAGIAADAVMPLLGWNLDAAPYFIELPYCREGNLRLWAERGGRLKALPRPARVALCAQLCDTVAALHEAGVIHRDLKPDNLYPQHTDDQGTSCWHLMLGDLGMSEASLTPRLAQSGLTRSLALTALEASSSAAGSLLYMAPELLAGEIATPASDVFALGVLLYQLLAGDLRRPLAPGWEADIDDELLREDIAQAAAAHVEQRTLTAAELAQRLRHLEQRRSERAAAQRERELQQRRDAQLQRQRQRLRWMIALCAGLAIILGFAIWMYLRAEKARQQAEHERQRAEAVQSFLTDDVIRRANPYAGSARDTSVHDAITQAADKIGVRFAKQPEAAVAVYQRIIDVYAGWGEYDQAKKLLPPAMAQAAKLDSPLPAAQLQLKRCELLRLSGDYAIADAACNAAQAGFDKAGQRSDETTAAIGGLMYERGDCAQAVATLAPVIERIKTPDRDGVLADALWSSALCLPKLARFDDADATFKRLVDVQTQAHGANDPLVGWALADYGQFLTDAGKFAQSQTMLEQAQKLLAASLGAQHPDAMVPGYSLAVLDDERGQWQAAIELLTPRLQRFDAVLGPRHLWTLYVRTELAYAQAAAGDSDAAGKLLDAVRPTTLDVLAQHPAKQAMFRQRWLRTEIALGRTAQAHEDAQALQQLLRENFPQQHPWHAQADCLAAELDKPIGSTDDARRAAAQCGIARPNQ